MVIESTGYELAVDPEPAWTMTPDEEDEQRVVNARNLTQFIEQLAPASWRARHRREASELLGEAQALIKEVRRLLAEAEGE